MPHAASHLREDAQRHRFELEVDGQVVFLRYRQDGDRFAIDHVEAPPALRGTGAAGRLMEGVMAVVRARGMKVVPICGYAAAWLRRHREWHDLRA